MLPRKILDKKTCATILRKIGDLSVEPIVTDLLYSQRDQGGSPSRHYLQRKNKYSLKSGGGGGGGGGGGKYNHQFIQYQIALHEEKVNDHMHLILII